MLVYCSNFELRLDTQIDEVYEVIANWIGRKGRQSFSAENLRTSQTTHLNQITVETVTSNPDYLFKTGIRITHGDNTVRGRQWNTEIGLWQDNTAANLHCSVLLETREVSTRVTEMVDVTRPLIVQQLIDRFGHSAQCPGQMGVLTLTTAGVADFQHFLESTERRHPIVLLSSRNEDGGYYYVNPNDVCFQTIGLADVYTIPAGEDTWHIAEVLGRRHSSWNGAINILFPVIDRFNDQIIPNYLLRSEMLESLLADGRRIETEILAYITHHTNLPNARNHLSPEKVHQSNLLQRIEHVRREAARTGKLDENVVLLEELLAFQSKENSGLKAENEMLQLDVSVKDDEVRQLRYEVDGLEQSLVQVKMASSSLQQFSSDQLELLRDAILQDPSPGASLAVIGLLFPERVIILRSALESAQQSSEFRYGSKVFELLWLLVTCYWEAFSNGLGDATARKCFGNAYAAKESETVSKSESARSKRTFVLDDGRAILMEKHLKHGVKDSVADTIRIHFEWLPDLNKIVIGHCGPHIDFG